jgi:hypothetical protein
VCECCIHRAWPMRRKRRGKFSLLPLHLTIHPYKQLNISILPFLSFDFTYTLNQNYKPENLKRNSEYLATLKSWQNWTFFWTLCLNFSETITNRNTCKTLLG